MARFRLLGVLLVLLGLTAPQATAAGAEGTEFFVRVSTPDYALTTAGITVPGYVLGQRPGAPALPLYGTMVELPASGDWTLDVTTRDDRLLSERITVRAARTPVSDGSHGMALEGSAADSGVRTVDAPDPAIYNQDAFYPPSIAIAGAEQWQAGKRLLPIQVYPFQFNPVKQEVVYHPDVTVTIRVAPGAVSAPNTVTNEPGVAEVNQADADELGALLLRTPQRGMYRLNYNDLSNAGVPVATVNPDSFQVTYLGQVVPIQVTGSADGRFDSGDLVIFYAEPYVGRWMASNVYRFSYGTDAAEPDARMGIRTPARSGLAAVTSGKQAVRIEVNKAYYDTFNIPTEADHIFDNPVYPTSSAKVKVWPYDVVLDDPIMAGNMTIKAQLYGGADVSGVNPDQWAKLQVNAHDVGIYTWNGRTGYTIPPTAVPMSWLDQTANKLNFIGDLNYLPALTEYYYYVDTADITYPATLDAEGDRIEIQDPDVSAFPAQVDVTGFSTPDVRVYDVRDPRAPVQLLTTDSTPVNGANQISFWDDLAGAEPAYSLTTLNALLSPTVEVDRPSSWKSTDNYADYIAVVHRDLWSAVQPLLDRRIAQGLKVAKVDVQDIYDEFNYGYLHQNAIRDFLKYAYENWNQGGPRPRYVVMVGDATLDYKKQLTSVTLKNLVPGFLGNFDPYIFETAADTRFVTFDGPDDVLPEMTIGRISARDATDLTNYINKVVDYENTTKAPDGEWQNKVLYVADNDENYAGNFNDFSDQAVALLPSPFVPVKIYYNPNNDPPGGYQSASVMETNVKATFDTGAVFVQWFGHAARYKWADGVKVWDIYSVPNLKPNVVFPFVAAFSCWDGYFVSIHNNLLVLAERHLFEAGKGSIGGLSPSGKHVGSALSILNEGLTRSIFHDHEGVIGDAADAARQFYYANSIDPITGTPVFPDVIDTSILFGDPVLRLRLPVPLSAPDSPTVSIQRNGATNADLFWEHVGSDAAYYEVYRSTEPYPVIGQTPTNRILDIPAGAAYGSGYEFVITDNGIDQYAADGTLDPIQVIGDPAVNHFWVVQSRSSSGQTSGVATRPDGGENIVGEFDFALVKGN